MKEKLFFIGLTFGLIAGTAVAQNSTVVTNRVVAAIEGEPITASDLRQYALSVGEKLPDDLSTQKDLTQKMLQELIIANLLEKEASALNIIVEDSEIDAYFAEVKRQNNFSDEDFEKALAKRGITTTSYRKQIQREIYRSRIMTAVIRNAVNISEEDIDRYLESKPNLLPQEGEFRLAQIYVKAGANDSNNSMALKKVEQIKAEAAQGRSLESLGGNDYKDLGYVKAENLRPEIAAVVENLAVGQLSTQIEVEGGFLLFQILAKAGEGNKDEAMRQNIRRELLEKGIKERMDRYVKEELPKKYLVEVKL